jgi:phage-related minor tail protein
MSQIERTLGELSGGIKSVLRELDGLREERREDVLAAAERVNKIEGDLTIVGKIASQARDVADGAVKDVASLNKLIIDDIKPQTDNIQKLSLKGMGFMVGIAFGGGALSTPVLGAIGSALDKLLK